MFLHFSLCSAPIAGPGLEPTCIFNSVLLFIYVVIRYVVVFLDGPCMSDRYDFLIRFVPPSGPVGTDRLAMFFVQ